MGFFRYIAQPLIIKFLGKGVIRAGIEYNKIDYMDKNFSHNPPFKQYQYY